jgi:hypothetical protein
MSKKITTIEFAEKVDLTAPRIRQLILLGIIEAEKFGRDYMIDEKYIEVIKNRPERRGRKPATRRAA